MFDLYIITSYHRESVYALDFGIFYAQYEENSNSKELTSKTTTNDTKAKYKEEDQDEEQDNENDYKEDFESEWEQGRNGPISMMASGSKDSTIALWDIFPLNTDS